MEQPPANSGARESILASIRSHLATSVPFDHLEKETHHQAAKSELPVPAASSQTLVELFKESLEAVNGRCLVVRGESEVLRALNEIISSLQNTNLRARSIATSNDPEIERLVKQLTVEFDVVEVTPSAKDVFNFDIGISGVQVAIAETGTLLLDSSQERHRLVSLVPPVHIAVVEANRIVGTLAEALAKLQQDDQVSSAVTLITGPSRTADIELTLAIGVHGPQELYVIVRGD